ncbi:enoyl-CoA hydratase-related protein [Nocardia abscessus]|uniref:enoyl-CoA hydratase-related protein n=1 Tax=Nocardia abscessus TaxID=120957 RepID=UPI002455CF8F|nr:enoyl-CoA hydratase-related protein [Nocardia abscessus]
MHIELDRPTRRNAVDVEMAEQLEGALDALEQQPDLRVAIISGVGGHFSAGTDLHLERSPATERGGEYGIVRRERSKPIIAAIEGIAFGGGLEIAMSCDLIVAAASARLALPEARRGVVPTCGGIFRIFDVLPEAMAMGLLLAGDEIDGATAGRLGLVTRVADDGEAIVVAHELADAVCRSSPTSISALLRAVRHIRAATASAGWAATSDAIDAVDGSPDMQEGIAAFFDRRQPRWHPDTSSM